MHKFLPLLFIASIAAAAPADKGWVGDYNSLLKKYVTADGVRYAEWKKNAADTAALAKVIQAIGSTAVPTDKKEQLAFYINSYNAWILQKAIDKYPTKSIKGAVGAVFFVEKIKVAGETMTLNTLEKDTIRAKFKEPWVHFALNCASKSCPPLLGEALRGKDLDAQLDKLARGFINSDHAVRMQRNDVELSEIFKWYADDFKATGGVIGFINKYRTTPIPTSAKITYQKYNWSLNEAR